MDHCDVRKITIWHQHMQISSLAQFSSGTLNYAGKNAPLIKLSQLLVILRGILPMLCHKPDTLSEKIIWIPDRKHRAYSAHTRIRIRDVVKDP